MNEAQKMKAMKKKIRLTETITKKKKKKKKQRRKLNRRKDEGKNKDY